MSAPFEDGVSLIDWTDDDSGGVSLTASDVIDLSGASNAADDDFADLFVPSFDQEFVSVEAANSNGSLLAEIELELPNSEQEDMSLSVDLLNMVESGTFADMGS